MVILSEIAEENERIREVRNVNAQKRVLRNFNHDDDDNEEDNDGENYQHNEDFSEEHMLESEDFRTPLAARGFDSIAADFEK